MERLLRQTAARGLRPALSVLARAANDRAPVKSGRLAASCRVDDREGDLMGAVGYTAEYAAAQHEHGEWKHAPGRGAKYLENACGDTRVHEKMTAEAAKEMRL